MVNSISAFQVYSPEVYAPKVFSQPSYAEIVNQSGVEAKTASVFQRGIAGLEKFSDKVDIATLGAMWGTWITPIADISIKALEYIAFTDMPFLAVSSVREVINLQTEIADEEKELINMTRLIFSLLTKAATFIGFVLKTVMPAFAQKVISGFGLFGLITYLIKSGLGMARAIKKSPTWGGLLNPTLALVMAAISLHLLFYPAPLLSTLQLVLLTGSTGLTLGGY
jgi:hypothetical protein